MNVKTKKSIGSIIMYLAAVIVAVSGIVLLYNNVVIFNNAVAQYVKQGYPVASVSSQLMRSQLLPGILQPIGLYGGVAFVLIGIGMVNEKVSKYLALQNDEKDSDEKDLGEDAVCDTGDVKDVKNEGEEPENSESQN